MLPARSKIYGCRPVIGWRRLREIEPAGTAYASIVSGEFALSGATAMPTMLKSTTTMHDQTANTLHYAENEHPGVILREEFLEPLNISQNQLALAMEVPRNRISQIIHGKRAITAETSIRLGRALGMSDFFFLNLQIQYEKFEALRQFDKAIDIRPIVEQRI